MLDFGFSEILLTSAIALVVLGPERLPKVARQVGNWMGRARAMARQLSEQLEREVSADELMKAQTRHLSAPLPNRIAPTPAVALTPEVTPQTLQSAHPESTPLSEPASEPALQASTYATPGLAASGQALESSFAPAPVELAARHEFANGIPGSSSAAPNGETFGDTATQESAVQVAHTSAVPDLHALPPEASPTPHADPRNPPNE